MTKVGHLGVATVPAVNLAGAVTVFLPETRSAMVVTALVLVLATCTVNDWDHPRFATRHHPGAALVRWSARIGYAWHTAADERAWERDKAWKLRVGIDWDPNDMHRGPSHCLEWCALLGLGAWAASAWALWFFTGLVGECWLLGLAVFVGTASHVLADACTPSGVPVSALYNWAVHRQVWRRHALGWRVPLAHVVVPVRLGFACRDVPVMSWVRWPEVVAVGERVGARQVRAGLFYTDEATDQYVIIPVAVMVAVVCGLAWAGELASTMAALTGWSG